MSSVELFDAVHTSSISPFLALLTPCGSLSVAVGEGAVDLGDMGQLLVMVAVGQVVSRTHDPDDMVSSLFKLSGVLGAALMFS